MMTNPKTQARIVFAIIAGLAIIIVLTALIRQPLARADSIPIAEAEERSLEVLVNTVGELDSELSTTVGSELKEDGKIVFLIEDGVEVKKDDILVRFDPGPFQEKVDQLRIKINEWKSVVAAQQQLYEWEKIQAEREIKTAEFDQQVAVLELNKIQNGDGPLELSRLEELMLEAKRKYEEIAGYIKDLEDLEKKGYSNPLEISQAKSNVEKLKKDYDLALQHHENYRTYIIPTLVKTAQSKVERTSMIIDETRKAVGFKIGKALADLNKCRQELMDLEELYKSAQAELGRTTIPAPQAGLVVHKESFRDGELRKPRIGDIAIKNQPILFLPDITAMMAKVLIREIDLGKVEVGKAAQIEVDAYPDNTFPGMVTFIGVLAERRIDLPQGEKYFKVQIKLSESDNRLRPGMTCRVRIESQKSHEKVLTIPIQAASEKEGRHFCYVVHPGGFERREIALGIQNEEYVEVRQGLKARERICLSPPPESRILNTKLLALSRNR